MANKPETEFKKVRAFVDNLAKAHLTFWIVKQYVKERQAHYRVMRVNVEPKLAKKLKGYVRTQLGREFSFAEYAYSTPDTDDVLLTMDADATDFENIRSAISEVRAELSAGHDIPTATKRDELLGSWAYLLELQIGQQRLYAWRKINDLTDPKRVKGAKFTLFVEEKLKDLDDEQVFLIAPQFDFFVFGEITFIADKKQFEKAMNFRKGMEAHRDELIAEFKKLRIIKNIDELASMVGDNLNHLRKLAAIRKAGYYKQPQYMSKLIEVNAQERWGLAIDGDQLVVELEKLALLLTALNNDRLKSPINDEVFDAGAKTRVGSSG